jgi:hypothetical protein
MRGASRGVLEVEQPDRAGAENSAGFCLGRVRGVRALRGPVCGARGFASQAKARGVSGPGRAASRPLCEELAGLGQGEGG